VGSYAVIDSSIAASTGYSPKPNSTRLSIVGKGFDSVLNGTIHLAIHNSLHRYFEGKVGSYAVIDSSIAASIGYSPKPNSTRLSIVG